MQVQNYFATKEKEHKQIIIAPLQTLLIQRPTSPDEYLKLEYLKFSPVNEGHNIYFLHLKKLNNTKLNWFPIPHMPIQTVISWKQVNV